MKQLLTNLAAGGLGLALATSCGGQQQTTPDCTTKGNACDWANHGQVASWTGDGKPIRDSGLYYPLDIEFSPDGTPYVIDWNNHKIRRVVNGTFETVIGNWVGDGAGDDPNADFAATGIPGTQCNLNHPTDMQFKPDGTLILNAWHNHKIRVWDPNTKNEHVLVGRGYGFEGDGQPISPKTLLNQQKAIVLTADGSLYVLDQRNQRIRRIDGTTNVITTVAGTGVKGYGGDGGDPLMAQFNFDTGDAPEPSGALAMDTQGRLYISDALNNRIRRIDFQKNTVETIIGTGTAGYSGDGGPASMAQINNARDLEFGPDGRLYIADTENHVIRAVDLNTMVITTVAGTGKAGAGTEGQPATKVALNRPFGIQFDKDGALYIADTFNNRIVKVAP